MMTCSGEVPPEKELLKMLLGRHSDHTLPALGLALLEKYDTTLQQPKVKKVLQCRRQRIQTQIAVCFHVLRAKPMN